MKKNTFAMKVVCGCLLLTAVFASEAFALARKKAPRSYRFINGKWFNGKTFAPVTAYSINGKLSFSYKGETDSTVDLKQSYIVPPFAEAHTHQFWDSTDYQEQIDDFLRKGIFYAKNLHSLARFTMRVQPFINRPESVDVSFAGAGITATDGHPVQIFTALIQNNVFPGLGLAEAPGQAYFLIDNDEDLKSKWESIKKEKRDFIKLYLEHSEFYEERRNDPKYLGQKGLDPRLLPKIVAAAHKENWRVSAHISSARDFHNAVTAGVDEIAHLPLERISLSDAIMAARKDVVVVTTVLSHRPAAHVKDLESIHRENLELLFDSKVRIAFGTDNMPATALEEAEKIAQLNVFDNLTLLKILVENTPRTIFPQRKIGFLKEGFEASFLALDANPLEDFSNVKKINFRFKQGGEIKIQKK